MSIVSSGKPSASRRRRQAGQLAGGLLAAGSRSVICEPMWHCTPVIAMPGRRAARREDRRRLRDVHPELVLAQPGRDVGVRPGVDVGVDAQRDAGAPAARRGRPRQAHDLALALRVELGDARRQALRQLRVASSPRRRRRSARPGTRRAAPPGARSRRRCPRPRPASRGCAAARRSRWPSARSRSGAAPRRRPGRRRGRPPSSAAAL